MPVGKWMSFLHLSATGKNCCNYGDRVPGVWFKSNDGKTIFMTVAITQQIGKSQIVKNINLEKNKWHKIELDHMIVGKGGKFTVTVDEKVAWTVDNTSPTEYKNVLWYQSDPWYESMAKYVEVKCLRITKMN